MKHPEDTKTLELLEPPKRGRGRPRKENALTPAQRAKRYRDNKRSNKRDVTEINTPIDDYRGAIETVLDYAIQGKRIPKHITEGLFTLVATSSRPRQG